MRSITSESFKVNFFSTYGPVPIGVFARSSTPVLENIAPIRVVMLNNQEVDGWLSTTLSSVGDTAVALVTTSIPDFTDGFQIPANLYEELELMAVATGRWTP